MIFNLLRSLCPFPAIKNSFSIFLFGAVFLALCIVTIETFKREIVAAAKAYDKYVICIDKTPEDFEASLNSLVAKAIRAYETRAEGLRHGIALDRQVTVILSQSDEARPMCGIYFNLHSPYQKNAPPKTARELKSKN
jgi:hypothetical protein